MCHNVDETYEHLFIRWEFATIVWFGLPMGLRSLELDIQNLPQWLLNRLNYMFGEDYQVTFHMCLTLWAIWNHRNAMFFRQKSPKLE